MRYLFTAALSILFNLATFATAQIPDRILFEGKEYILHSNPLEIYFEKNPDKRPKEGLMSTALWRGYVATFEVRDRQLFVKDIEIQYWDTTDKRNPDRKWKSVMKDVFPGVEELKVDWLTGLLVLPSGKLINYVHMGYGSTYENYLLLEINKGEYVKSKQFNHKEYEKFKDKQFEAYRKTDQYKETKARLKKEGNTDQFIDDFLRSFVIEYSSQILDD